MTLYDNCTIVWPCSLHIVATIRVARSAETDTGSAADVRCGSKERWGTYVRRSLKTKSWERAQAECNRLEQVRDPAPEKPRPAGISIPDAVRAYLQDAKDRGLRESTLSKLDTIFRKQFLAWAAKRRFTRLADLDVVALRDFRSTWKDKPLAKSKKQSRVMGFFHFCQRSKWVHEHPMLGIGAIRVDQTPTDYFPADEFERLIDSTYLYRDQRGDTGNGERAFAPLRC